MSDYEAGQFVEDEETGAWEPVLIFDTDDPEFTRGFTCGRIWQAMELDASPICSSITSDNLVMVTIMADAKGYDLAMEDLGSKASGLEDADWLHVTLTRRENNDADS